MRLVLVSCAAAVVACSDGGTYAPIDSAIGWVDSSVVFTRTQQWAWGDYFESACSGSGIFMISTEDHVLRPVLADSTHCPMLLYDDSPRVAPDGRSVVIRHRDLESMSMRQVFSIVEISSGTITQPVESAPGGFLGDPIWSNSGTEFLFQREEDGASELRAWSLVTQSVRTVGPGQPERRLARRDSLSGDLYFRSSSPGSEGYDFWVARADSLGVIEEEWRIPPNSGWDAREGELVIAIHQRSSPTDGTIPPASTYLAILDLGSDEIEVVFRTDEGSTFSRGFGPMWEGSPLGPMWSPDGSSIVFSRAYDHGSTLWQINRDGTELRQLTRHDPGEEPRRR